MEQADARGGNLVQQFLGSDRVPAGLVTPNMAHLAVSGVLDNARLLLEELESQQAVMVGRLVLGRNAQPDMIRVEGVGHVRLSLIPVPRADPTRLLDGGSGGHV
jgi:hypothetical protein